jgi:hypothetical protein
MSQQMQGLATDFIRECSCCKSRRLPQSRTRGRTTRIPAVVDETKTARIIYGPTAMNNMSKEYLEKQNQMVRGPINVPDWD